MLTYACVSMKDLLQVGRSIHNMSGYCRGIASSADSLLSLLNLVKTYSRYIKVYADDVSKLIDFRVSKYFCTCIFGVGRIHRRCDTS
jgi:exo-beta-1,3-glucanase (GH17 family)